MRHNNQYHGDNDRSENRYGRNTDRNGRSGYDDRSEMQNPYGRHSQGDGWRNYDDQGYENRNGRRERYESDPQGYDSSDSYGRRDFGPGYDEHHQHVNGRRNDYDHYSQNRDGYGNRRGDHYGNEQRNNYRGQDENHYGRQDRNHYRDEDRNNDHRDGQDFRDRDYQEHNRRRDSGRPFSEGYTGSRDANTYSARNERIHGSYRNRGGGNRSDYGYDWTDNL